MRRSVLRQAFRYNAMMAQLAAREMWEDHRRIRLAWMRFLATVHSFGDYSLYHATLVEADKGYASGLSTYPS